MTATKSYTDLEQSKKLAEILPLESADMMYHSVENEYGSGAFVVTSKVITNGFKNDDFYIDDIPCWSLAALLDIIKTYSSRLEITLRVDKNYNIFAVSRDFVFRSFDECSEGYNNIVDACYEMILKLHELKML